MPTRTRSRLLSPTTEKAPKVKEQPRRRGASLSRGRRKADSHWFKVKMEALSVHFNPVLFPPPGKGLEIGARESLLKRLGLWDFLTLEFDEAIREDLVKELVVSYSQRKNPRQRRRCQVNGLGIDINRSALGKVLRLPLKRDAKGGAFSVSEEEVLFLEELIWTFLVLRDEGEDASLMSDSYMLEFAEVLKEKRYESADWAGLVYFMLERELMRGSNLTRCYYAAHLQLLMKHQKPELFGGAPLESGQTESVLTKCGKRMRESLYEGDDDNEGKRSRNMHLAGRELFLDEDDAEGKILDLAGRELRDDGLMIGGGNLDAMRQSEDLLENGEKISPNLQVNSNADICSSDCDMYVTWPGHTYNPSESGIETAEAKVNDHESYEGIEIMQVTYCHAGSAHVEGRINEGVMNFGSGASGEAHHEDQNDMIEGGAIGAESEANSGNAKEVHCRETGIVEEKEKGSAVEGSVGDLLDEVPCVEEDDIDLLSTQKAHDDRAKKESSSNGWDQSELEFMNATKMQCTLSAVEGTFCETSSGNALELHCMKEDDAMLDETSNENALKVHCLKGDYVVPDDVNFMEDNVDMNGDSIADVAGEKMDCQKVDVNFMEDDAERGVGSMTFVGLLMAQEAHRDGVKSSLDTHKIDEHGIQQKKLEIIDEHQAQQNVANEAFCETGTGNALELHCMKEDYVMLDETSNENALKVHCMKGDYVVPDEPSESHIADLLIVPSLTEEVNTAQDCCQQKFKLENEAEKNSSGPEIECQVYTGKEVDSVNEVDLDTNIGKSVNVHCEQKDDVLPLEEQEAASDGNDVNSLGVCGFKEDVMEDKESVLLTEEVNTTQDCHQQELELKNEAENNREAKFSGDEMECQEVYTVKEVEPAASVGWLMGQEAHDEGVKKVGSSDGLDSQDKENQQKAANIIENQHQFETGCINATKVNGDNIGEVVSDGMNYQEADLNCMAYNAGMKVEFENSVDLVETREDHYGADFSWDEMAYLDGFNLVMQSNKDDDALGPLVSEACEGRISVSFGKQNLHKIQPVQIDLSSSSSDDEEGQNKFKHLEIGEGSGMNGIAGRTRVSLRQFPLPGCNDEEGQNKFKHLEIGEGSGMNGIAGRTRVSLGHYPLPGCNDEEGQNKFKHLEIGEGSGMNGIAGRTCVSLGHFPLPGCNDEEGQNKFKHLEIGDGSGMNDIAGRTRVSLGQFPLPGCNFGMTAQYGHGGGTYSRISNEHVERLRDFNDRAENVNVSVARLMDLAKASMEESDNTNTMLQKKAEEQNQLIMKYELMLQKARHDRRQSELTLDIERQKKQREDLRYERELDLMNSVLQGHKKSIKEMKTSITKFMERSQIPEGYMVHPDGGGRLVLVSEWEQEQKNKIKATLENFEEQWKSTIKEQSGILGVYNDRIEDIKHALKTMKP